MTGGQGDDMEALGRDFAAYFADVDAVVAAIPAAEHEAALQRILADAARIEAGDDIDPSPHPDCD